jgi:hypothetical protein
MKVLYLHGLGEEPGGILPISLRRCCFEVVEPSLPHGDFNEAVRTAQNAFDRSRPDIVVGFSRGGAIAMDIDSAFVPLILIAPAWRKWLAATQVKPNTVILHSAMDRVIPIADSLALIRRHGLPTQALRVVGESHAMADRLALDALSSAVTAVGESKLIMARDEYAMNPRREDY